MASPSSTAVDFSKKALVLVTGASRGIGKTIAVELSRKLNKNSIVILLARSESGLEQTKSLIQEVNKTITVLTHPVDLAKADSKTYERILDRALTACDTSDVELGILFHNAASTGALKQTSDLTDFAEWRDYFDMNLFSVSALTSVFIRKLRHLASKIVVVNITSMCGRTPYKNLAMYGSAKAAREMFFKVLALEEPSIPVLSYSPGPVDTDMFTGVIEGAQSAEVQEIFRNIKQSSILTTEQTVGELLGLLEKGDFISGDFKDFYDREISKDPMRFLPYQD